MFETVNWFSSHVLGLIFNENRVRTLKARLASFKLPMETKTNPNNYNYITVTISKPTAGECDGQKVQNLRKWKKGTFVGDVEFFFLFLFWSLDLESWNLSSISGSFIYYLFLFFNCCLYYRCSPLTLPSLQSAPPCLGLYHMKYFFYLLS